MKTFELVGQVRDGFGKKAAKKYRSEGLVPCVVYGGKDGENISFTVKDTDILKLVYTPEVYLIDLTLGENKSRAILKEIQFHPVRDSVLHIDFLHVYDDVPVVLDLPVKLEGLAKGVKAGGRLTLDSRYLKVRGMADKLPERLIVDATNLELDGSIQVGELEFEDLEILTHKSGVVCRVRLTRAARAAALGMTLDELMDAEEAAEAGEDLVEDATEEGEDTEGAAEE